jgi:TolB protein
MKMRVNGWKALTIVATLVSASGCAKHAQPAAVVSAEPATAQVRTTPQSPAQDRLSALSLTMNQAQQWNEPQASDVNIRPFVGEPGVAEATTVNVSKVTFAQEGGDFDPSISRDGSTLVFASTQHRNTSDIYVKQVNTKTVTQLTRDPAQDVMPAISPDGSMIAYCSDRSGNWDVFVMPVTGGKAFQITSDITPDVAPSWSPDGTQLVFSRLGETSGRWEMWTVRVAKPEVAQFIGYGLFPKWCPTAGTGEDRGDQILFQLGRERGNRGFSLWTLSFKNGEASNPTQIVSDTSNALINPTWSPDGKWIVYAQVPMSQAANTTPDSSSLWMTSTQGEGTVRLTTGHGVSLSPTWSKNNQLFFVSNRDGVENVWSLRMQDAVRTANAITSGQASMAVTLSSPEDTREDPHAPESDDMQSGDDDAVETASEDEKNHR